MRYAAVSRDGKWAAWTWFHAGPAADVFVAPTDGSSPPTRLTATADNTLLVSWTPDSHSVIVAQDRDGNERAQLFQVDLDQPLAMQPLTPFEPNYYIRGGELHPNGRYLVYGANFDVSTGQEIEPVWIYRHDLNSGEQRPLARPQKGGYIRPRLSPLGTHILYPRMDLDPSGRQTWLVDIDGDHDREILSVGSQAKTFASWFPDGQRVLVLAETPSHRRVGIWKLADSSLRWLIDDPRRNIEQALVPYGSQAIVIVEVEQARARSSLLNPDTGEETPLPATPGTLIPLAPATGEEWVGQIFSSRQPSDVVRFSVSKQQAARRSSVSRVWNRTPLTACDLTPAEDFHWTSVDGLEIQGWLYRPEGEPKGTIVLVHGGPSSHSEDRIDSEIQFLVRRGFVVLNPNYRGSTGFGMQFREAIKEDGWGGREQEDIRAGIEALLAEGIAQPGKVGITGTSYGGYSSWCGITRLQPKVLAAAAPICGMTDLVVDYESTRPDLRPYSEEMMGGSPDEVPERYRERSPVHFVGNIEGCLLIIQGSRDPNVTPENVRAVTEALHDAEVPYELLTFEDEGHGISKPKNQRSLFLRLARFFESAFSGQES